MHRFTGELNQVGRNRCVDVPPLVSRALGGAVYVAVSGTMQGAPFRSTLVPRGGGYHRLFVPGRVWRTLALRNRAPIEVTLEADATPRGTDAPDELVRALECRPVAAQLYAILTPTLRAEIIRWIRAAKNPATRERRLEVGMDRLEEMAHRRRSSR
jgi:hypothetical protein